VAAYEQVAKADAGMPPLQIGPCRGRMRRVTPQVYDCARAGECQWQLSSPHGALCPPREALRLGVDPRFCAY
jgi:hypothetical protein